MACIVRGSAKMLPKIEVSYESNRYLRPVYTLWKT
jgi:hypothetical protein